MKIWKSRARYAKAAGLVLMIMALLLQANYTVVGQMMSSLLEPTFSLQDVPPLEQNAMPEFQPAADIDAPSVSPITVAQKPTEESQPQVGEDTSGRTENSKTIINADGTTTKEVSLGAPLHYKKNGAWADLKPSITSVDDTISMSVGDIKMTAHSLGQGIDYQYKGKKFSVDVEGANDVAPKLARNGDKEVLIYQNAFDDVDITYDISGYAIKESIVVKSKTAVTKYGFSYSGVTLSEHKNIKGAITLGGLSDKELYVAPVNVITKNNYVTEPVAEQQINGNTAEIHVSEEWFRTVPEEDLPIVIDPTMTINKTPQNMQAIRSDDYSCNASTCSPTVGNEELPSYMAFWRTFVHIPFNEVVDDDTGSRSVISASMKFVQNGGVPGWMLMEVRPAECMGFTCGEGDDDSRTYINPSNGAWQNVLPTINWMIANGKTNNPLMIRAASEGTQQHDVRTFDLSQMILQINYQEDNYPPNAVMTYPADKQVISELQPILTIDPVADPDGQRVTYSFWLMSRPGEYISSAISVASSHWAIPEGLLKDGVTYYWSANADWAPYNPRMGTSIKSFKVDLRKGKSSTQSYDTVGPVSIDQATGNLSTSVSSHKMKALGGDIGVSLDYNTPAISRAGLVAEYWNNESLSGDPKLTTLTPNIDFDWASESPFPSSSPSSYWDSFSARYSGVLSVPQSGTYTLGAERDDGVRIWINSTLVLDAWSNSGTSYGTPVSLSAGVNVNIKIEYRENTGQAKVRLLAKTPMIPAGAIVERSWLRTGVKPIPESGLTADYYHATDGNGTFASSPVISGEETSFDYEVPSLVHKVPGGVDMPELVRYRGFIEVPAVGAYRFIANHDGGLRMRVNGQQIIDNWSSSAGYSQSSQATLTPGTLLPIELEYWPGYGTALLQLQVEGPDIARQIVPASWLKARLSSLPAGWQLGVDDNGARYDAIRVNNASVLLIDSTGSTHEYKWENNGFVPPLNERGILTRNTDGTHTFKDDDGKVYIFGLDGSLSSMMAPTDDRRPAGLKYVYSGTPSLLTKIVDSVNVNRYAELFYAGINAGATCAPPTGFEAVPYGYLCKIKTTDGVETNLHYKLGNLARVQSAGNQMTDYGYDSLRRLIAMRDPLANDAIAAGVRTLSDGSTYDIGYDALGKAKRVVFPAATPGATRIAHNYTFLVGATQMKLDNAIEPSGYSRRVEYDSSYRTVKSYGHDGKFTQTEWDAAKDIIHATTDPLSLKTTTIYDANDRPIEKYGPAPATWFGPDNKPLPAHASNVPKAESEYDEGMQGLSASFYDNKYLVRELKALSFEQGDMTRQWTSANRPVVPTADGWGLRLNGELILPATGDYTIKVTSDDGVRLYIDNRLYTNDWTDGAVHDHPSATYTNSAVGKRVSFRIEYYDKDQSDTNSRLELRIYKPGSTEAEALQTASFLAPSYSLTTSESVTDNVLGEVANTRTYNKPEYGILDKITLDGGGLNYVSTTTTEAPGAFFRQTSKTLPGGNKTTYQYYGSLDMIDNPCTIGLDMSAQAGLPKGKTEPDPDGSGPLLGQKSEMIYDRSGQVIAARMNAEDYSCTTYDARGRVTKVVTPSSGARLGMTSETNYTLDNNPLKIATTDTSGSVVTEIDLLGRIVKYTDAHGNTSTPTYDAQGRITAKASTHLGTETFTYDDLDRLTRYSINGVHMANIYYDTLSRVQNIDYPASNIKLLSFEYDDLLRVKAANWQLSDGTNVREEQAKSTTGLITANTRTIGTDTLGQSYTYDKAGRLRTAAIGTHTMSYGFDPLPSSCGVARNTNAHKNANRTSQTVDGATTTYCYDNADRLTSSSDANYDNPIYDDRANVTQIGPSNKPLKLEYDQANRAIRIEQQDASGNGNVTEFKRDAGGRILDRKQIKLTNGTPSTMSHAKYGYTTGGDSPDIITNMSNGLLRRVYSLPGGISLTIHANQPDQSKQRVYSIPNFHGDVMLTTDYFGVKNGSFTYDPFGNQLNGSTPPQNNATPGTSKGYLGQYDRLTENEYTVPVITMGDRIYLPRLGRFMQTDPVEGGNANTYIYPADPVNGRDVDGNLAFFAPIAWFVVKAAVAAVVIWAVGKAIDKVVPPPYRESAHTTLAVVSYASPKGAARVVVKAPTVVPKAAKQIKNVFGSSNFKSSITFGKQQHEVFKKTVMGDSNTSVFIDYGNGKHGFADAITRTDVFELKPDNSWSRVRGMAQLKKYSDATGLNGQLWVYRDKVGIFKCIYGCTQ